MPIEFRCTQCNRLLRTREDAAGKKAKCPECGTVLEVPASAGPPPPPSPFAETGAFPPASDSAKESPFSPGKPAASDAPSPFGGDVPLPPGAPAPENPYESPLGAGPLYTTQTDSVAYARERVSGPAIALIVTGAIGLAVQLLAMVANVVQMAVPGAAPDPEMMPFGPAFGPALNLAFGFLGLAFAILVILGAVKMKNLQNYALAMTSAIVALIPCTSPCCCLGLPFGIWALVVLCDGQVQAAFRSQAAEASF